MANEGIISSILVEVAQLLLDSDASKLDKSKYPNLTHAIEEATEQPRIISKKRGKAG